MNPARIASIDVMRVFAMLAVVVLHTKPFEKYDSTVGEYVFVLLNQGARFAVPFFFVIAGYFWAEKLNKYNSPSVFLGSYPKRILVLFGFWSLVYWLEASMSLRALIDEGVVGFVQGLQAPFLAALHDPWEIAFEGVRRHLWFFPALLCALAITAVFVKMDCRIWLVPFGGALYVWALLAGSYSVTPVGLSVSFRPYVGPFVSTLFFAIGMTLSGSQRKWTATIAMILVGGGLLVHMTEAYLLWRFYSVPLVNHEFLLGTVLFGTGVAVWALASPSSGEESFFAELGSYMVGVYVVHALFVDLFGAFNVQHVLWEIGRPVVVFVASLLFTVLAAQSNLLKRVVV